MWDVFCAYEVAVVSVARPVTVGEHEGLLVAVPLVPESLGVVVDFVEQRRQMNRVRRWTPTTVVVAILGIRHMRLVVLGIEVLTVPARGELIGLSAYGL